MGNFNSIDTDTGIGTILSHFSTEYINHVVEDSLNMKFRPFEEAMPNMVDVLERQFVAIKDHAQDYQDEVSMVRVDTYKEIIDMICNYYNLSFMEDLYNLSNDEVYGVARTMYEIFVSRFTEYMINFFVSYIVNSSDDIALYLRMDENSNKPKETGVYDPKNYIESKYIIIHANINRVIYDMASYDISLQMLLNYFVDTNTANRLGELLEDNGDIYKNYYATYILDQKYSASVLTNIKLQLQTRTQQLTQF